MQFLFVFILISPTNPRSTCVPNHAWRGNPYGWRIKDEPLQPQNGSWERWGHPPQLIFSHIWRVGGWWLQALHGRVSQRVLFCSVTWQRSICIAGRAATNRYWYCNNQWINWLFVRWIRWKKKSDLNFLPFYPKIGHYFKWTVHKQLLRISVIGFGPYHQKIRIFFFQSKSNCFIFT